MRRLNLIVKRMFDIVVSTLSLIILIPVFLIISIIIKIDSKGPVFFIQKRLGKNGEPFDILKFRTMVVNAENIGSGLKVSTKNDARITGVGKFLRKTSLDELPQLLNVLTGKMSLVGPRPPVCYHPYNGYVNYPDQFKRRFDFKPGVTGLAQVELRNSVTWEERIKRDLIYIEKFNVLFDLKILFMTVAVVFRPNSIYLTNEGD